MRAVQPIVGLLVSGVAAMVATADLDNIITAIAWLIAAAALFLMVLSVIRRGLGKISAELGSLKLQAEAIHGEVATPGSPTTLAERIDALAADARASATRLDDSARDRGQLHERVDHLAHRVTRVERHLDLHKETP